MDAVSCNAAVLTALTGRNVSPEVTPTEIKDDHAKANAESKKQRAYMKFALSCRKRKLAQAKEMFIYILSYSINTC